VPVDCDQVVGYFKGGVVMQNMLMLVRNAILAVVASTFAGMAAADDSFPSRSVRMMVGLTAGGPSDLLARTIASGLQEKLGQSIIVENRTGAGGILAALEVAKSAPDGYTIQFAAMPAVVFVPLLNAKLPYQQDRDFTPIGSIASYSLFLFANPELPVKGVADLIKLAKAKPGVLTYASGGIGTSNHLAGELLKNMAGIEITHVPYKGNVTAQQDLMAGRVSVMFDFLSTTQQFVNSGKLRLLATTGKTRSSFAPDVPSLEEAGLKGFDVAAWFGLFVKAGTPKPVIDKLNAALRSTLQMPEIRKKLATQGYEVTPSSPEELAARIKADSTLWAPIIKNAGIKAE
jgi:tripartite-type tricarboxylate transporter receptor subunit TctC